jgi:outer membrane protein assembly factor BamE (lipoprotein component of BamABCDE complex)
MTSKIDVFVVVLLTSGFWLFVGGYIYPQIHSYTNTRYSKTYSDTKFKTIKIGMSMRELLAILGEPLKKYREGDREIWYYSQPKEEGIFGNTDWRPRGVEIRDEKVIMIIWWTNID